MRARMHRFLHEQATRILTAPLGSYLRSSGQDVDRLKRHVRKGDVLLVCGDQRVSEVIRYLTQSSWSHSAIYVGDELLRRHPERARELESRWGDDAHHLIVEAIVEEGVVASPISKYRGFHLRLCRPFGLESDDLSTVMDEAIAQIGGEYDVTNLLDLARYFLPVSLVPARFRREALAFGSGRPTEVICSSMIARAAATTSTSRLRAGRRAGRSRATCAGASGRTLSSRRATSISRRTSRSSSSASSRARATTRRRPRRRARTASATGAARRSGEGLHAGRIRSKTARSRSRAAPPGAEPGGGGDLGSRVRRMVVLRPAVRGLVLLVVCVCLSLFAPSRAAAEDDAEAVFAMAADSILQIRVVETSSGAKALIGSGFFVGPAGRVVTNYHVVSKLAHDPGRYRIECARHDGTTFAATIDAIDVVHDLALLRSGQTGAPALPLVET